MHWLGCQILPAPGDLHSASSPPLTVFCLTSLCVSRSSNHSKTQGHPYADLCNSFLSSRLPANSSYVHSAKLLPLFPVPSEDTALCLGPPTVSGIWKCLQEESQGECGAPPPRFLLSWIPELHSLLSDAWTYILSSFSFTVFDGRVSLLLIHYSITAWIRVPQIYIFNEQLIHLNYDKTCMENFFTFHNCINCLLPNIPEKEPHFFEGFDFGKDISLENIWNSSTSFKSFLVYKFLRDSCDSCLLYNRSNEHELCGDLGGVEVKPPRLTMESSICREIFSFQHALTSLATVTQDFIVNNEWSRLWLSLFWSAQLYPVT